MTLVWLGFGTVYPSKDSSIQGAKRIARAALRFGGRIGFSPYFKIRQGIGKGLWISLDGASANYWKGANELPVQQALSRLLTPGGTFLDVGSNIGFFALMAARLAGPGGRVYAIEPVPHNVARINANAQRNGFENIHVLRMAAGRTVGYATLYLARHPGGATLSAEDPPHDMTERLEVPVTTVDHLIEQGLIRPPSVVKIDVEGTELDVLEGMRSTLSEHRPAVIFEVDAPREELVRKRFDDVSTVLEAFGYEIRQLENSYPLTGWCVRHGSAIFHSPQV